VHEAELVFLRFRPNLTNQEQRQLPETSTQPTAKLQLYNQHMRTLHHVGL
jgi:hypothetical protein